MQAIVQDHYGSADVLQLQEIDKPAIGVDDVWSACMRLACTSVTGT